MKSFELLLSYKCNSRCVYCFLPAHRREETLPLDEAVLRISRAREDGAQNIYFSGGEPTIYPDLIKLVKVSRELAFSNIILRTNGMRLAYPDYLEKLISAGVNGFCVSVKSHISEIHEKLSRVEGGFEMLLSAIRNISASNARLEMDIFTHSQNYESLLEMTRFFYERSARNFNYQFISSHFSPSGEFSELLVSESIAAPYIVDACKWVCSQTEGTARIYYVSPCFLYPDHSFFYNLKNENLLVSDVSGSSFYLETSPLQGNIKTDLCRRCGMAGECPGFRQEFLEIYGEPEDTPFK